MSVCSSQSLSLATPLAIAPIEHYLRRVQSGHTLSIAEASGVVEALLHPATTDAQAGGILAALSQRGETPQEVVGFVQAMRARMQPASCSVPNVVDTAGTGSSRLRAFNVSTAAAVVAASIGVPIAKHGGRAGTSASGSGEVLQALGVNIQCSSERSIECLQQANLGFFFGPMYHPAMARIAPVRKQLGIRTTFNLAAPLSNPLGVRRQLVGVATRELVNVVASAVAMLGTERTLVVHGEGGLDEISISGETTVVDVRGNTQRKFTLTPEAFGKRRQKLEVERGGPQQNAALLCELLAGRGPQALHDLVVCNGAAAASLGSDDADLAALASRCDEAIASGAAARTLARLIELSSAPEAQR